MPSETEVARRPEGRWNQLTGQEARKGALDKALENFNGDDSKGDPSYYDISMLQKPVWTPEVGIYFFLGGLSSGAYTLARLGERLGGPQYRNLTRTGTAVALATALPCAPLLIKDLGDPKRFHHMLRVFKPHSPMNLGSWVLSAYTAVIALASGREYVRARQQDKPLNGAAKAADTAIAAVSDVGVPLGLLLAGYTGVLLSTTSVPIWGRNPWLGALFSAGAVSSGASAVHMALAGTAEGTEGPAGNALKKVETAAHLAEAATLVGYIASAGEFAKPLTHGPEAKRFWGGAVITGLAAPTLLGVLPLPPPARKWLGLVASLTALFGVFALRMTIVEAGRPSADDPEAARRASRKKESGGIA
jgi:formate-dependent nitrite reductase membrane component NrfD